jgi:serine/threonine protein kinase
MEAETPTKREAVPIPEKISRIALEFYHEATDFQLLGRGGMGEVFRFCHKGQRFAIKVLHLSNEDNRRRFLQEVQILAAIHDPHIVRIFHYGESEGELFYIMEYIPGCTLKEWQEENSREQREILAMVARICRAMEILHHHDARIIHRDLKPSNILIQDNEPVLIDLGIAKILDPSHLLRQYTAHTLPETILGSYDTMSPEQIRGQIDKQGTWSDVFSLGIILYELLSGQHPFYLAEQRDRDNPCQYASRLLDDAIPLRERIKKVHPDLDAICRRALELNPSERYADAGAMAADLERFMQGEAIESGHLPWHRAFYRWARRHKAKAAGYFLGLLLMCGLVFTLGHGWNLYRYQQEQEILEGMREIRQEQEILGKKYSQNILKEQGEKSLNLLQKREIWQQYHPHYQKIWQLSSHFYYTKKQLKNSMYLEWTKKYYLEALHYYDIITASYLLEEIKTLIVNPSEEEAAYKKAEEEAKNQSQREQNSWYNDPEILYLIYQALAKEKKNN